MTLGQWKVIAEIFQSFAIGVGAILGGIGALKVLGDWAGAQSRKRRIKKWRRRFPKSSMNEAFKLIYPTYENVVGGGEIYIKDLRTNTKHWVADPETLETLGFNFSEAKGIPHKDFDEIKDGDEISLAR